MSGIADINLNELAELKALPEGTESRVRVTGIPEVNTKEKDGSQYIRVRLCVFQEPDVKDISYFIGLPDEQFDDKQNADRGRRLKKFCEGFDIDMGTGSVRAILDNIASWEGLEAWAILGFSNDDQYGEQNHVKKLRKV